MKTFNLFTGPIQTWNGEKQFRRDYEALIEQIDALIDLQSGLGQTSQGHPEDYQQRCKLMNEERKLARSIHNALGL